MFVRRFEGIREIKKTTLFKKYLCPDIVNRFSHKEKNNDVFPAVRNGRLDFYYNGGKLFSFTTQNNFITHYKYAAISKGAKRDYISEKNLKTLRPIEKFSEQYERIKENCAVYAGVEAKGVSRLSNRYSCAKKSRKGDFVVLDVEVSFKSDDEGKSQDRVDLLLFNTKTGVLRFYEAKAFENGEIRSDKNKAPKVVNQVNRYRKQLDTDKKRNHILTQYKEYVNIINELFLPQKPLPEPKSIDPEPCLFIFGFDEDQRTGRLKKNLQALRYNGVKVYVKGNVATTEIEALWKGTR